MEGRLFMQHGGNAESRLPIQNGVKEMVNVMQNVYTAVVMQRVNVEVQTIHVEMEIAWGVGCTCRMNMESRSSMQNKVNVEGKCILGWSSNKAVMQ